MIRAYRTYAYDNIAVYKVIKHATGNDYYVVEKFGSAEKNLLALYFVLNHDLSDSRSEISETKRLLSSYTAETVREKLYSDFGNEDIDRYVNFDYETDKNYAFNIKRPDDFLFQIVYEFNNCKALIYTEYDGNSEKEILVDLYGILAVKKVFDEKEKDVLSGLDLSDEEMVKYLCTFITRDFYFTILKGHEWTVVVERDDINLGDIRGPFIFDDLDDRMKIPDLLQYLADNVLYKDYKWRIRSGKDLGLISGGSVKSCLYPEKTIKEMNIRYIACIEWSSRTM